MSPRARHRVVGRVHSPRIARCVLGLLLVGLALPGCERTLKNMYEQPRLGPEAASPLFADGKGSRPPVPGTEAAAMGDLAFTSAGRRGGLELDERHAAQAAAGPPPPTRPLLMRGRDRYDVFCAPCHSPLGDGDGMVVRRGFPHPPTFHQARLREASDRHLYDVIGLGLGVMPPLGDRVTPQDRWAIVAYVRVLQLSQHAPAEGLPPDLRAALAALRPPPGAAEPATAASSAATAKIPPPAPDASEPGT